FVEASQRRPVVTVTGPAPTASADGTTGPCSAASSSGTMCSPAVGAPRFGRRLSSGKKTAIVGLSKDGPWRSRRRGEADAIVAGSPLGRLGDDPGCQREPPAGGVRAASPAHWSALHAR